MPQKIPGKTLRCVLYLNEYIRHQHTEITLRSMKMRQHGDYIWRSSCSWSVKLIQEKLLKSTQAPDVWCILASLLENCELNQFLWLLNRPCIRIYGLDCTASPIQATFILQGRDNWSWTAFLRKALRNKLARCSRASRGHGLDKGPRPWSESCGSGLCHAATPQRAEEAPSYPGAGHPPAGLGQRCLAAPGAACPGHSN